MGENLNQNLESVNAESKTHTYSATAVEDKERHIYVPVLEIMAHGFAEKTRFGQEFFESSDYQGILKLGEMLDGLLEGTAYVARGERKQPVSNFKEALTWIMAESKRGYNIQRYKGLGEMNPEQLWETTMDPESRRMLKVTIEDAIQADQIFTCLMGDQVEPRRDFIESNALNVANLDV